jgi:hypothetical protein
LDRRIGHDFRKLRLRAEAHGLALGHIEQEGTHEFLAAHPETEQALVRCLRPQPCDALNEERWQVGIRYVGVTSPNQCAVHGDYEIALRAGDAR